MAPSYFTYVVAGGDYLDQIAHRFGVSADQLKTFPKNKDLAAQRGDMSMLVAGDLLFIPQKPAPEVPLEGGQLNSYVVSLPKVDVHLRLVDDKGPIAGEDYTVEGLDAPLKGTTDGEGMVSFAAPITTRMARILLAKRPVTFEVVIGGLDPADEISGAQMRLNHLGFYGASIHGQATDHFRSSLRAFQQVHHLERTGELDEATRAKLISEHGS